MALLCSSPVQFARVVGLEATLSARQLEALWQHYVAENGLLGPDDVRSLAAILQRFGEDLEVDFQVHYRLDLVRMFRTRQWRKLLNFVRKLPANSHYRAAIQVDREMALAAGEPDPNAKWHPEQETYSAEVRAIGHLIDEVRQLRQALIAVNSSPGKQLPPVIPYPQPRSVWPEIEAERRQAKHERLAARILPPKKSG